MTELKAGVHAMVEIAGEEGSLAVVRYPGGTCPIPASALHPLPPHVTASDAALADATEDDADRALDIFLRHRRPFHESWRAALNDFLSRRRAAIPETTREEPAQVPAEAAAPARAFKVGDRVRSRAHVGTIASIVPGCIAVDAGDGTYFHSPPEFLHHDPAESEWQPSPATLAEIAAALAKARPTPGAPDHG